MSILKQVQKRVLSEGLKKVGELHSDSGDHHATIHKDHEWGEYRVKFHSHGVHNPDADYHTDDKDDAHGTAEAGLKHLDATNKTVHEEVESVVEVSNTTLVNYAKKAHKSLGQSVRDYSHHREMHSITGRDSDKANMNKASHTFDKRRKGLHTAAKKSSDVDYISRHESVNDLTDDSQLTEEHLDFILDTMTVEEFEQLDEISKGTLFSYASKVKSKIAHHDTEHMKHLNTAKKLEGGGNDGAYNAYDHHSSEAVRHAKKADVHSAARKKAVNKLAEEEQLDETGKADVDNVKRMGIKHATLVTSRGEGMFNQKHPHGTHLDRGTQAYNKQAGIENHARLKSRGGNKPQAKPLTNTARWSKHNVKEGRLLKDIIQEAIDKGGRPKKPRTLDGKIAPGA